MVAMVARTRLLVDLYEKRLVVDPPWRIDHQKHVSVVRHTRQGDWRFASGRTLLSLCQLVPQFDKHTSECSFRQLCCGG
jgi:hypothetical protein